MFLAKVWEKILTTSAWTYITLFRELQEAMTKNDKTIVDVQNVQQTTLTAITEYESNTG